MLFWFAIWLIALTVIGAVATISNRRAENEIELSRVKAKLAEIERRKAAAARGEDVPAQRRKSRRLRDRRK